MSIDRRLLCVVALLSATSLLEVRGHGRLIDPVARSSAWRYGFKAPHNYNDNELFCGGVGIQYGVNNGLCGVCGDDYSLPRPRPNELGGYYGKGFIVKTYRQGDIIKAVVQITASHLGHFEFHICPLDYFDEESEACFRPLRLANGKRKFMGPIEQKGDYELELELPWYLTCKHCVLRWTYVAGNNWETHVQETYRGCADVAILRDDEDDI
ncbi:uncharacterized protein LOC106660313 [Trichogramma pretiosum]|uniref:uncharacterized protein LOC106660313 n=1 Tax=Trichogramma pretiosum TaxID=7493 RepID=UPI0006C93EFB|nr:uncharacterized protein LOC106660313 [Trichogramma pretiosum]